MADNLKTADTNRIIGHLADLSTKTEEIFLKLAQALPALFREIESGMNEANHLIKVFSKDSASHDYSEQDNLIINSIDRAETLIGDAAGFYCS